MVHKLHSALHKSFVQIAHDRMAILKVQEIP
jgi:hypothetical protein